MGKDGDMGRGGSDYLMMSHLLLLEGIEQWPQAERQVWGGTTIRVPQQALVNSLGRSAASAHLPGINSPPLRDPRLLWGTSPDSVGTASSWVVQLDLPCPHLGACF